VKKSLPARLCEILGPFFVSLFLATLLELPSDQSKKNAEEFHQNRVRSQFFHSLYVKPLYIRFYHCYKEVMLSLKKIIGLILLSLGVLLAIYSLEGKINVTSLIVGLAVSLGGIGLALWANR
jgi:small-conductance mechanosensitive channel